MKPQPPLPPYSLSEMTIQPCLSLCAHSPGDQPHHPALPAYLPSMPWSANLISGTAARVYVDDFIEFLTTQWGQFYYYAYFTDEEMRYREIKPLI